MITRTLKLLVLPLALSAAACMPQTDEEAFSIDGAVYRVVIETGGGDVRLVPGASDVRVDAQLAWVGERPDVKVDYRGGELRLRSPCLDRGGVCEVSYTVTVPPAVAGDVRTRAGDIFFEGEFEPVTASSEQGSISRP